VFRAKETEEATVRFTTPQVVVVVQVGSVAMEPARPPRMPMVELEVLG
jgi:hypothetical protein